MSSHNKTRQAYKVENTRLMIENRNLKATSKVRSREKLDRQNNKLRKLAAKQQAEIDKLTGLNNQLASELQKVEFQNESHVERVKRLNKELKAYEKKKEKAKQNVGRKNKKKNQKSKLRAVKK